MIDLLKAPALVGTGIIAGEAIGRKLSPSFPLGTGIINKLLLPSAVFGLGVLIGRHASGLHSLALGIKGGAVLHAAKAFFNFDANLENW